MGSEKGLKNYEARYILENELQVPLIRPRARVWCVRKKDDVMSDDVIVDYIIAKNGEMTLLVHVSPFKG